MRIGEYFVFFAIFILVVSISSAQLTSESYNITTGIVTDGGDGTSSNSYNSTAVVGIISGDTSSDNYTNQLGVFYGLNTAPDEITVTLNSSSGQNITSDNLLCSATINDADSDSLSVYTRWYVNGALGLTQNYTGQSNGLFVSTLNYLNTTKHENWSCGMQVYDGSDYTAWANSSNITILNDIPIVTLSSPADGTLTTDRTPSFEWSVSDDDSDSITYEINITPYYGANPSVLDERFQSGISSTSYVPSSDLLLLYDNGYHYQWKVRAYDGEDYSEWTSDWKVNISAQIDIVLTTNAVYFGSLGVGDSNNTDDPGLDPLRLENNGTVVVNVSVNASPLWNTQSSESSYYQFKADNVTGEEFSFNQGISKLDWFNMPFTSYVIAIGELNYSDSADSAEVDINLTVPPFEDPGVKSSSVVFLAELGE